MADDTSLLQEIDDALRADRLEKFWAEYSSLILICCALIVFSSIASVLWRNHRHDIRERQTTLLIKASTLVSESKYNEAITMLGQARDDGGSLAALAALKEAETLTTLKQDDKVLALYDAIADGKAGSPYPALKDYARLQSDILRHNKEPGAASTLPAGGTYAVTARELQSIRALSAGDMAKAGGGFSAIVQDEEAPMTSRERAADFLSSVKGTGK